VFILIMNLILVYHKTHMHIHTNYIYIYIYIIYTHYIYAILNTQYYQDNYLLVPSGIPITAADPY
jgi:hypothetical protein